MKPPTNLSNSHVITLEKEIIKFSVHGHLCMFFIRSFFHNLYFSFKKFMREVNQLIDHNIHGQEFRYLPPNCCVQIIIESWPDYFRSIHFRARKSDNRENGIQSLNKVILMIITH